MASYTKAHKKYYTKNKDYINSKKRIIDKNYRVKIRTSLFEILGFKCAKCDFDDTRALQIDHVNSNGAEERKKRGSNGYYNLMRKKIMNGSKDYQILCANCNWIKRVVNNELTK